MVDDQQDAAPLGAGSVPADDTSGAAAGDLPAPVGLPALSGMPHWIYRLIGVLIVAVIGTLLLVSVFRQLTGFLGIIILSLFVALALEPGVNWLARHGWKRGLATMMLLVVFAVAVGLIVTVMVPLVIAQVRALIVAIPQWAARIDPLLQQWFGVSISQGSAILESEKLLNALSRWGVGLAGNLFGLIAGFLGLVFQLLTISLFAFYFVADGPRIRRALLSVLRAKHQREVLNIWDVAIDKIGGYLYSRMLLSTISGVGTFAVLTILRVPFALPLAIWMGLVSQFIPAVGTYIAAALPLLVTVLESPQKALILLVYIILYQQVENYLFYPRVFGHTMAMHPAVAFGSVIVGATLFGAVGAFLAIPAAAILQAVVWASLARFEVMADELTMDTPSAKSGGGGRGSGLRRWLRSRRKKEPSV